MKGTDALKSWLTVPQTGGACISRLGYFLSDEEIYRLALDGHLRLCAVFPTGPMAKVLKQVAKEEIEYEEMADLSGTQTLRVPVAGPVFQLHDGTCYQEAGEELVRLAPDSPFELAMIGGERAEIEQLLWKEHRLDPEDTTNIDGTFLAIGQGAQRRLLQIVKELPRKIGESVSYFPVGGLPTDTIIAVTPKALDELAQKLESEGQASSESAATKDGLWPWGSHETKLLRELDSAARKWWMNFDPSDNTTAPTNEDVSTWLQDRGVSKRIADAMATILRADKLPTGPRT